MIENEDKIGLDKLKALSDEELVRLHDLEIYNKEDTPFSWMVIDRTLRRRFKALRSAVRIWKNNARVAEERRGESAEDAECWREKYQEVAEILEDALRYEEHKKVLKHNPNTDRLYSYPPWVRDAREMLEMEEDDG